MHIYISVQRRIIAIVINSSYTVYNIFKCIYIIPVQIRVVANVLNLSKST